MNPTLQEPWFKETVVYLRNSRMRFHAIRLVARTAGMNVVEAREYVDSVTARLPIISAEHAVSKGISPKPTPLPEGYKHHPTLDEPDGPY